ncbi:anthranilate phosphoribosyltransferase [Halovivax cerinus]|uniref:Anthranilate phosphoribosyltransferase n=1 Tax=Halovivax cerinus TaxID=1487865 RepID=A0ABD5NSU8_9EURY|nr:anthranilate phosphoribosyltransferase [Halovivax cerinus]
MSGDSPLDRLLSDVVGSGPRSSSDMTYEQAFAAMEGILTGEPDPTVLGGFWIANRWKGNTPTELAAFVDAMRTASVEPAVPDTDPVDIGANYDGKADTPPLGVASGIVAAAAGTPVAVHSADRVPTTDGVTYRHVLDELGVRTDLSPAASAAMVDEIGFGFYDAVRFNPGLHALLDRRRALGLRTFVNTIETLANPTETDVHLGSFFHRPFAERMIATFRESRTLAVDRVVMVNGQEGSDDVRPGTVRLVEWTARGNGPSAVDTGSGTEDQTVELSEIETGEFGVAGDVPSPGDDLAADGARLAREVVRGERRDAAADVVSLNAGVRIYARGDASTLSTAVDRARDAIADGRADAVLATLEGFDPADHVPCRSGPVDHTP